MYKKTVSNLDKYSNCGNETSPNPSFVRRGVAEPSVPASAAGCRCNNNSVHLAKGDHRGLTAKKVYTYAIVETNEGWVAVAGRDGKVSSIRMPAANRELAFDKLRAGIDGELVESNHGFEELARQLKNYFAGRRTEFTFEPDLDGLTEFQQKILRTTMTVPYGSIVSYRRIAEQSGHPGAYRAAGQALGRNPVPVAIPCHRVVASGGKLGGFTGGINWKVKLLGLEGVRL